MSNAIFPTLPGLQWDVKKTPQWSTKVQQSAGGKELRASYFSYPIYKYTLAYDVLRQVSAFQELQTLAGFFSARQGKYDSFLFQDPNDNAVPFASDTFPTHGFGAGDGSTTAFQLQRTAAGPRNADGLSGTLPVLTGAHSNFVVRSEQFDDAAWTKTGLTVTPNTIYAPNGTLTADVLTRDATTPTDPLYQYTSLTLANGANGSYAASIWLRAPSPITVTLTQLQTGTGALAFQTCNVTTKWQRFVLPFTQSNTSGSTQNIGIGLRIPALGVVHAWGAMLEFGGTANAYISTASAAVGVAPNFWPATGDGFEPIYDLDYQTQLPQIFVNGVLKTPGTDYTISSSGLVTFTAAPAAGAQLSWIGSYFFRVRFDLDAAEFNEFLYQLWDLKQLTFLTVK